MERVGLRSARRLGPRGSGDRSPTLRELRDGLRGYLVVRIGSSLNRVGSGGLESVG
jgi:hypothetical protein